MYFISSSKRSGSVNMSRLPRKIPRFGSSSTLLAGRVRTSSSMPVMRFLPVAFRPVPWPRLSVFRSFLLVVPLGRPRLGEPAARASAARRRRCSSISAGRSPASSACAGFAPGGCLGLGRGCSCDPSPLPRSKLAWVRRARLVRDAAEQMSGALAGSPPGGGGAGNGRHRPDPSLGQPAPPTGGAPGFCRIADLGLPPAPNEPRSESLGGGRRIPAEELVGLDPTEGGGQPRADAAGTTMEEFADQLWRAEPERSRIEPLTDLQPNLTVADAYAVQSYNVRRKVEAGRTVRGRRLGRTSQVRQHLVGADEPDFGVLLDDMFIDEGEEIAFHELLQPRVLATIAFVMAADLAGPGLTVADALTAVAGVLPAIEVADSRIADWRGRLPDTVADNASAGRVVLGSRLTPVGGLDLRLVGLLLYRNGAPIASGAGAAALGSPLRCVSWLAGALAVQGRGLDRGDIVLAGPLHRLVPVRAGDHVHVEFAHLGSVTAQFGAGGAAA